MGFPTISVDGITPVRIPSPLKIVHVKQFNMLLDGLVGNMLAWHNVNPGLNVGNGYT